MIDDEQEIQYFAGGATWDITDKAQEFLNDNVWILGWDKDANPNARQSYNVLQRVKVGDFIALKSMAGRNHIKIYAIGKVKDVVRKHENTISIDWTIKRIDEPLLLQRPSGEGVGNWQGTFLQITNGDLIEAIFNKSLTPLKEKPTIDFFRDLPVEKNYLDFLTVNNYFNIKKEIILQDLKNKKEIYFLGKNGDGKTLILQAILISLVYSDKLKDMANLSTISKLIELVNNPQNREFEYLAKDAQLTEFVKDRNTELKYRNCIFAYGVHRDLISEKDSKDPFGFMTLCDDIVLLRPPLEWLQELHRNEKLNEEKVKEEEKRAHEIPFGFKKAKEIIESILSDVEEKKIKIAYNAENNLVFKEEEETVEIKFEQLSTGYKSVLVWVCDLLSRLIDNDPECSDSKYFKGIVLVDEIDLYLHPKWAYSIVRKLREWFENIQFFFTTHSPIVILGASKEAVIYKVYKEKGITKISEPYYTKDFSNAMANTIITSPLFDLDTARMFSFNESANLDTSDSYLSSKIHKKIAEDIEELKLKGQRLFTDKEVDELIEQALLNTEQG